MSIFDRLDNRIVDKTDNHSGMDNLDNADNVVGIQLSSISVIQDDHIQRVLLQLKTVKPYRSGTLLMWRGNPTSEQLQLLRDYRAELVKALTPSLLTTRNYI